MKTYALATLAAVLLIAGIGILKDFTPLRVADVFAVFMIIWAFRL